VDPFYLAAHVILALNAIVSRRLDPFDPAVVSLGRVYGGEAENVIPHQVELSGTLRFMNKKVREQIHDEVHRAFEVARTLGGDYSLEIEAGGLPMINDPRAVELIKNAAVGLIGAQNVLPPIDTLGAEDFSVFTDVVPGAMFSLGARIEGDERQHHNPRFDIDEGCLPIGAAILAEAALDFLRRLP